MAANHAFAIFNTIRSISSKVRSYIKLAVFSHKKLTTSTKDKSEEDVQSKPPGLLKKAGKKLLGFFTSYTIGLIFTAAAGAAMLFSPFGIVFGAVMCSLTITGAAVSLIRKTQRFRTLERCKEQHNKLNSILDLSENNQKTISQQPEKVRLVTEFLSSTYNKKLKEDIVKSIESQTDRTTDTQKSKFGNAISKISAKMRYIDNTSMVSSISLALPSIISGNPVAIILFALGFSSSGYMTYDKEKSFRKSKDELLKLIDIKNGELAKILDLTEEQISKITSTELSLILNHKLAEAKALEEINEYAKDNPLATHKDLTREYSKAYDQALQNPPQDKKNHSFLHDMGKILVHGINSEKEKKLFSTEVSKTEQSKQTEVIDKQPTVTKQKNRIRSKSYSTPLPEHKIVGPHTKLVVEHEHSTVHHQKDLVH